MKINRKMSCRAEIVEMSSGKLINVDAGK